MAEEEVSNHRRAIIAVAVCVFLIILAFVVYGIVSCTAPALSKFRLIDAGYSSPLGLYEITISVKVNDAPYNIDSQDFSLYVLGAPRVSNGFASSNSTYRYYKTEHSDDTINLTLAFEADELTVDKPIKLLWKGKVVIEG